MEIEILLTCLRDKIPVPFAAAASDPCPLHQHTWSSWGNQTCYSQPLLWGAPSAQPFPPTQEQTSQASTNITPLSGFSLHSHRITAQTWAFAGCPDRVNKITFTGIPSSAEFFLEYPNL